MATRPTTKPLSLAVVLLCAAQCARATLWQDCAGVEGISGLRLHFTSVVSDPDPLHTGQQQTITKVGRADSTFTNITSTFSQYWCATDCREKNGTIKWQTGLPWVRFLKITLNCPDGLCESTAQAPFNTSALHPKLNPLTPHGWYRSRQVYHDGSGADIGCADMIIQYVSKSQ